MSNPSGIFIDFDVSQSKHISIKYSIDWLMALIFLISLGSFKFNFIPLFLQYFCTILSLTPFFSGKASASISNLSISLFASLSAISFSLHILSNSGIILFFFLFWKFEEGLFSGVVFFSINFIFLRDEISFELLSNIIISSLASLFILSLFSGSYSFSISSSSLSSSPSDDIILLLLSKSDTFKSSSINFFFG